MCFKNCPRMTTVCHLEELNARSKLSNKTLLLEYITGRLPTRAGHPLLE